jgi:hypothetical protein
VGYEISVAVVASWLPRFELPVGDNDLDKPYAERLKVDLTVKHDETLRHIYQRAVDELQPRAIKDSDGYVEDPLDAVSWTWFYESADADGIGDGKRYEVAEDLITVDEGGLARWRRSAAEIPYQDLTRAGDRGVLRGDPLRPYLVLLLPQGPHLVEIAWREVVLLWQLIGHLLTARELLKLTRARRERLGRAVEAAAVVERHGLSWSQRGGGPAELLATLERRPWAPDDLRMLLGLASTHEAVELLEVYGFVPNQSGEYEMSDDEESRLLREIADEASRGRLDPEDPEFNTGERVRAALETGELPPWTPF